MTEERRIPHHDAVERLERHLDRIRRILGNELSLEERNWVRDLLNERGANIEEDPVQVLIDLGSISENHWHYAEEPEHFVRVLLPEEGYMAPDQVPEDEP